MLVRFCAMAGATLDSAAAEDRARKLGLSETTLRELKEHGFATFGSLCFAVTSNPANLDDAAVDNWVGRIFNSAPPSAYHIRRLMFEAQSLNVADLRARVDPPSESAVVRKLLPRGQLERRRRKPGSRLSSVPKLRLRTPLLTSSLTCLSRGCFLTSSRTSALQGLRRFNL